MTDNKDENLKCGLNAQSGYDKKDRYATDRVIVLKAKDCNGHSIESDDARLDFKCGERMYMTLERGVDNKLSLWVKDTDTMNEREPGDYDDDDEESEPVPYRLWCTYLNTTDPDNINFFDILSFDAMGLDSKGIYMQISANGIHISTGMDMNKDLHISITNNNYEFTSNKKRMHPYPMISISGGGNGNKHSLNGPSSSTIYCGIAKENKEYVMEDMKALWILLCGMADLK